MIPRLCDTNTQDKLTKAAHNTTDDDACDVEYNFAFDGAGRPTTVQVGSQTLSTTVYNPDGTVQKVTYGNSSAGSPQEARYTYDDFKRLKGVQFDGETSDAYTYEYGANGQVMRLTDTILDRRMMSEYDTANRPMRITHMEGESTHLYTGQVEYDEYNNLKTFKEQVGTARTPYQTDFTYDDENKPTQMTFGDTNNKVAYAYDAIGRVSSRTVTAAGHAFATAYGYAAGNNGSGNTTPLISSLTQSGENFTYTYDDVGNIASVVQNNKTTAYTYDALGQLIRVNDENDPTSGTAGTTWTYEYDRGGNILEKKRYAYTTGTLGTALETMTYTYDTTWKDKLIQYSVQVGTDPATTYTVTSDAIGNPTNDGTWTYTWARGRQLQVMYKGSFGQPGYDEIAFTYNHEGLRTRKTRMYYSDGDVAYSSTEYTLHGKNIVHMTQGSDSLHFFYDASNRPAIVEWNNGVTAAKYAYIQNLQGDIVGIVDSIGTEVVKYTYDAWGKVLSTTGSLASTLGTIQPFRYRGYVYDVETGLYYLRSRYYNPTWGRFLNADELLCKVGRLFTSNAYSYCINAPVTYIDLDGFEANECKHVYFKNTYRMSGVFFYSYLLWQFKRHPNESPEPPIIDALKELVGIVADEIIDDLDNWFSKGKKVKDYSFPIIDPFLNYNYKVEGYIVDEMTRNCCGPNGYKEVTVELLYGSHSAEVHLTLVDKNGKTINCNIIETQGYDVILDMMDCMKLLVENYGGDYYHEGVGWKYTMAE